MRLRQAVILCGGLGTRLGPLTARTPKPLLGVGGAPFLDTLLLQVARHGLREVVLLAGFAAEAVEAYVAATPLRERFGLDIKISTEPAPAGTGGALYQARDLLAPDFLMLNGDSWFDINLLDIAPVDGAVDWLAAMSLRDVPDASRYGVVTLADDRVTDMRERPAGPGAGLVNAGVYVMRRAILDHIPPVCSLERDVLPSLARTGRVRGAARDGFFIDIGVPDDFARAQVEVPARNRKPAVFFDRDGVLNHDHGHVGSRDRFEWVEGAIDAIRLCNDLGWYVFVVTNQAGIGKGLYSEADFHALHAAIDDELAARGAHIDDLRFCPFHEEAIVERYRQASDWRKPAPGMILDLLRAWPVDLGGSFLIGDRPSDLGAAGAAGLAAHLYQSGNVRAAVETLIAGRATK